MSILYNMYIGELTSVCRRYVPAESEAKDVLQNSFVKILTSLPEFEYRDETAFKGWMKRIVANESISYLKAGRRLPTTDLEAADRQVADTDEEPAAERVSPDELHRLIGELPDGYRTVLNLFVFEGYSHRQIAELLGCTAATSASQLHHAKRLLAIKIKKH